MATSNKISALDVIQFFKEATLDVAELVIHVAASEIQGKVEVKKAASDRMAKARAGRGKGKAAASPATAPATTAPASQPVAEAEAPTRHRAPRVQAPAHTAAATSVESDTVLA